MLNTAPPPTVIPPQDIDFGSRVRSFDDQDFRDVTGPGASFIEGTVIDFRMHEGCHRYRIQVSRVVKRGIDRPFDDGYIVIPPLNGTPRLFGAVCNGVELL